MGVGLDEATDVATDVAKKATPWGAILTGATSLFQTGFGLSQYFKGKKAAADLVRPEYEIPPEVAQNMSAAELQALEGLPADQKRQYIEDIQRAGVQAMGAMGDSSKRMAGAAGIFQKQSDAYRNLLGMDAGARQQNQGNLADARLTMAGFKEKQQQLNEFQPYQQDYMTAQAQMGAGMQNMGLGFGSAINTGGQIMQNQADLANLEAQYGGTQTA